MLIERTVLGKPFALDSQPKWRCPACGRETLFADKSSLTLLKSARTLVGESLVEWEHGWTEYRVAGFLHCSNPRCKETVAVSGEASLSEEYDEREGIFYEVYYDIKTYLPPVLAYDPPSSCLPDLAEAIRSAQRVMLLDHGAAANAIRRGLELMCDAHGVAREQLNSRGEPVSISLADRLAQCSSVSKDNRSILQAVRIVGNEGSHSTVTLDDVFDALDLMAYFVDQHYAKSGSSVMHIGRHINRSKKPRSKSN